MKLPLYFKFVKYYLPLLLIFLVLSIFLMFRMYAVAESNATTQNLSVLENAKSSIDEVLRSVFNDVYALKSDPQIIKYKSVVDPFDGPTTIQTIGLQTHLDRYFFEVDVVYDSYILFPTCRYAINSSVICSFQDLEAFYINYANFETGHLVDTVFGGAAPFGYMQSSEINSQPDSLRRNDWVITLHWSISDTTRSSPSLVLLLSESSLRRQFTLLNSDLGEGLFIVDSNGQPISRSLPNQVSLAISGEGSRHVKTSIDGKKMLISYAVSDITGWKFVAVQNFSSIVEPLVKVFGFIFAVIGVLFILSLSWSLMSAYLSSKPINEIMRIVGNPDVQTTGNKLTRAVVEKVSFLATQNERLSRKIIRDRYFLEQMSVGAVLNGTLDDGENRLPQEEYRIEFGDREYTVGALRISGLAAVSQGIQLAQISNERSHIMESLQQFTKYPVYEKGTDTLWAIFSTNGTAIDFPSIYGSVVQQCSCVLLMGVGRPCNSRAQIHRSAEEAMAALSFAGTETRIAHYEDSSDGLMEYFLSRESLRRFEHYISSGVYEEALKSLDELFENVINNDLFLDSQKRLTVNSMISCLVDVWNRRKLVQSVDIEFDINELIDSHHPYSTEETKNRLKTAIEKLADVGKEIRDSNNSHMLASIVEYIKTNYQNPLLSSDLVAGEIGISPSYLSRFMKSHSNTTFHEYVEMLRIQAAEKLLTSSTISVKDVAEQVGFSSHSSFGRAYRRVRNMSPTEYRNGIPL